MKALPLKKPVLPGKRFAKLIEAVESGKEGQHIMASYIRPDELVKRVRKGVASYHSCGTAGCIAGWATLTRVKTPYVADNMELSEHMDNLRYFVGEQVPDEVLEHLIAGVEHDGVSDYTERHSPGISLPGFDRLPPRKRKNLMLAVLREFAKTGRVEWHKFAGSTARKLTY